MTSPVDFTSQHYFRNRAASLAKLREQGPDHKRLRDIVDEALRRRAVIGMEPYIQATAERLADWNRVDLAVVEFFCAS